MSLKQSCHFLNEFRTVEFGFGDHPHREAQPMGALDGVGLGIVANHVDDLYVMVILEIFGDTLQVGAVAGDEYGEPFHS